MYVRPLTRSTDRKACYLNLGGPRYYVGLDLHKRYVTACAVDSAGQVVAALAAGGYVLKEFGVVRQPEPVQRMSVNAASGRVARRRSAMRYAAAGETGV